MAAAKPDPDFIIVHDRRTRAGLQKRLKKATVTNFEDLKSRLREVFQVSPDEDIFIIDSNKEEIRDDEALGHVRSGDTVYLWSNGEGSFAGFAPGLLQGYHTCTMKNPIVLSVANLVDSAIYGTALNSGQRVVEIDLHFDVASNKNGSGYLIITDNGNGMSLEDINDWAMETPSDIPDRRSAAIEPVSKSLNSNLSYHNVGGKEAIFAIGSSFQIISKCKDLPWVYRLSMSKLDFDSMRFLDGEFTLGPNVQRIDDITCLSPEDEVVAGVFQRAITSESCTAVVLSDLLPESLVYLRDNFDEWTTRLAHIYHYYIHGKNGRGLFNEQEQGCNLYSRVQIKAGIQGHDASPIVRDLSSIEEDFQSCCIRSCSSYYDFKAYIGDSSASVEGIVRYHPVLNGKETYPSEEDHWQEFKYDDEQAAGRGQKPIFECYWNGRLMPCTSISEFEWCSIKKAKNVIPAECYARLSGVLFTNDYFRVSPDKHAFIDLEAQLNDKDRCSFAPLSKIGLDRKIAIEKDFIDWLKQRHTNDDKEIKFRGYRGLVVLTDRLAGTPDTWSEYCEIEWAGTVFKRGMLVRTTDVEAVCCGSITRFLLRGAHLGDVYASEGEFEVTKEPRRIYGQLIRFPLNNLDRKADDKVVLNVIKIEELRLPERISIEWPEGLGVEAGDRKPLGTPIGTARAQLLDGNNEAICKPPGPLGIRKLLMEMKLIHYAVTGEVEVSRVTCEHGKSKAFWFRNTDMELKNLGRYSMVFQALSNEDNRLILAGKKLPLHRIDFIVTEGEPEAFTVRYLDGPFCVGIPFQIPLEFTDKMGNSTKPNTKNLVPVLEASGVSNVKLTYGNVIEKAGYVYISDVVAAGTVAGKTLCLKVTLPSLKGASQSLKMRLSPGIPKVLAVEPSDEVRIEHGQAPAFTVKLLDMYENVTSHPQARISCQFLETKIDPIVIECAQPEPQKLVCEGIVFERLTQEKRMIAQFEIQGIKDISPVQRTVVVVPSCAPAKMRLFYNKDGTRTEITENEDVSCAAGSSICQLEFEMYDESGRLVNLGQDAQANLKVNWWGKLGKEVTKRRLPDIKAATNVIETRRCVFTYGPDQDFAFTLRTVASEPAELVCKCSGSNTTRLGLPMASHILVTVLDKYRNEVQTSKNSLALLAVHGEGLATPETVRSLGQNCNFDIGGIRFTDKRLGKKTVFVEWNGLKSQVDVTVDAGIPTSLTYPGVPIGEMPIQLRSNTQMPFSLRVQLSDEAGNPVHDKDVKIQLSKSSDIKLSTCEQQLKTGITGQVDFGQPFVSGKSGQHELWFKAFVGRIPIGGAPIVIKLEAEVLEADRVVVTYKPSEHRKSAGSKFGVFEVAILGTNGMPFAAPNPSLLSMKAVMKSSACAPPAAGSAAGEEGQSNFSWSSIATIQPHNRSVLLVRNVTTPLVAGIYDVTFSYDKQPKGDRRTGSKRGGKRPAAASSGTDAKNNCITSTPVKITVCAGPPAKLGPALQVTGLPVVSSGPQGKKTIIKKLLLQLQDCHDNRTGFEVDGVVVARIVDTDGSSAALSFAEGKTSISFQMRRGEATVKNLELDADTEGEDGKVYKVHFLAKAASLESRIAFTFPFVFKRDVTSEAETETMRKRRDFIQTTLRQYSEYFETQQGLLAGLRSRISNLKSHELKARQTLRKDRSPAADMSVQDIRRLIEHKKAELMALDRAIERPCSIQPAPSGDADILGKVCHLAYIEDDDVTRVISWHLANEMNVLVTRTSQKAQQLSAHGGSKLGLLPIDSIDVMHAVDEWTKPLPHEALDIDAPEGNFKYAKHMLYFLLHHDECKLVFGSLLGDTLLADTLAEAEAYRTVVGPSCPTILTRDGYRLPSSGIRGGSANIAPKLVDLRNVIFGRPCSAAAAASPVAKELTDLLAYDSLAWRIEEASAEVRNVEAEMHSVDVKAMHLEFDNLSYELELIEQKIADNERKDSMVPMALTNEDGEVVHVVWPSLVLRLDEELSDATDSVAFVTLDPTPYGDIVPDDKRELYERILAKEAHAAAVASDGTSEGDSMDNASSHAADGDLAASAETRRSPRRSAVGKIPSRYLE